MTAAVGACKRVLDGGKTSPPSRMCLHIPSGELLNNENEVNPMGPEKPECDVRHYCDDFTIQSVQKFLEFALVVCHSDVESVNFVLHLFQILFGIPPL